MTLAVLSPSPVPLDLGALYPELFPRVYAFAVRMLGDREAALDAAQDVFTNAVANAASFRGESAPLTWLLSIARNVCLRRLERGRRSTFATFETLIETQAAPMATHTEVERRVYVAEVTEGCLAGLLQCLTVGQRSVFVLHLLNGFSIAEVAGIMAKSENSVRISLSRARSRMRDFLCRNCALLGGTRCRCEDMVEFSLRSGLIERFPTHAGTAQTRDELRAFADEVDLYRALPDPAAEVAELVAGGRYAIFAGR